MVSGNRSYMIKDHQEEGRLRHLTTAVVAFLIKVLSFFRFLIYRCERLENVHPSDRLVPAADSDPPAVATIEEDHVAPCLERLQKLEMTFSELSSKPAVIPVDKEQVLQESWDRIKSIEFDLEKTKKVSPFIYFYGDS